jgi:protein-S-isoprenylcysteine O-methyltransferase Ste14
MYIGVTLVLVGWAAAFHSLALAAYAACVAAAFHVRVLVHEEPFLARTFGNKWTAYRSRTRRWL